MEIKNELQTLENCLESLQLNKYSILQASGKRYCLFDNRNRGLTGYLDYETMYHFISGYGKAMKKVNIYKAEVTRLKSLIYEFADKIKSV